MASPTNSFIIMGHGKENADVNFDARPSIPPGYTLVTLAVCGISTSSLTVLPILEAFHNPANRDILSDPVAHKEALEEIIGNEINIYTEGYKYPNLTLSLFSYYRGQLGDNPIREDTITQSGVFKFPMDYKNLKSKHSKAIESFLPGATAAKDYSGWGKHGDLGEKHYIPTPIRAFDTSDIVIPEIVTDVYEDSILPTQEEVRTLLDHPRLLKNSTTVITMNTVYPLEVAFERGGPGVYYYVICRNLDSKYSMKSIEMYFRTGGIEIPEYEALSFNEKSNNTKVIEAFMPAMKRMSANIARKPYSFSNYEKRLFQNAPAKFQAVLNRTRSIRRHSATQQKKGGATKRRKRKYSH